MISNRAIGCFVAPRCSLTTLTCSERRVFVTDIIKTRSKSVPNKGGKETAEEGKHGFGDSRGPAVSEDWSRRTAVYPSGTMGLKVATGFASGGGICIYPKKQCTLAGLTAAALVSLKTTQNMFVGFSETSETKCASLGAQVGATASQSTIGPKPSPVQ